MKDLEKYFDLLENKSNMTAEEIKELEKELNMNFDQYTGIEDRIEESLNSDQLDAPSEKIKSKLDQAFVEKHESGDVRHNGIISIKAFSTSSPWKMMATAASISLILFLSVQMGYQNRNFGYTTSPYLADSIDQVSVDSNYIQIDSLVLD